MNWDHGFPVEEWGKWDSFYKGNLSCSLQTQGGKYILLHIDNDVVKNYIETLPIYDNTLPNGIFTWIMYSKNNGKIDFAAIKVQNAFEIGTSHKIIALRVGAKKIYGAGELYKEGDTILFNTQSGTYTKKWMNSKGNNSHMLESIIQDKFREFLKNYNVILHIESFIKRAPISEEDITLYRNAGFQVEEFDTRKKCISKERDLLNNRIRNLSSKKGGKTRKKRKLRK